MFENDRIQIVKKWLKRLLFRLGIRSLKTLFWVTFAIFALGVPWCAGALFHAFDIPAFVSWGGIVLLAGSLLVSLFFRWALLGRH